MAFTLFKTPKEEEKRGGRVSNVVGRASLGKRRAKQRKLSMLLEEMKDLPKKSRFKLGEGILEAGVEQSPAFEQVFKLKEMLDRTSREFIGKKYHDKEQKILGRLLLLCSRNSDGSWRSP